MDLAENRFRKTWERFLEVLKVDCHVSVSAILSCRPFFILIFLPYMRPLKTDTVPRSWRRLRYWRISTTAR